MSTQDFNEIIEAIFAKLAVRYGAAWLRQWDGVEMKLVKADWSAELDGFRPNLEPLRYALRHLPERCPNVAQFKALANACPPPEVKRLEAPQASEAVVAAQIAKQAGLKQAYLQGSGNKDWARSIMARIEAGERIRPYTALSARQALGLEGRMSWL